jgi:hypothetical protein
MLKPACSGWLICCHSSRQRVPSQALSSSKLPQRRWVASSHTRRRLSCTFFSTMPFSQPLATLQKSASIR